MTEGSIDGQREPRRRPRVSVSLAGASFGTAAEGQGLPAAPAPRGDGPREAGAGALDAAPQVLPVAPTSRRGVTAWPTRTTKGRSRGPQGSAANSGRHAPPQREQWQEGHAPECGRRRSSARRGARRRVRRSASQPVLRQVFKESIHRGGHRRRGLARRQRVCSARPERAWPRGPCGQPQRRGLAHLAPERVPRAGPAARPRARCRRDVRHEAVRLELRAQHLPRGLHLVAGADVHARGKHPHRAQHGGELPDVAGACGGRRDPRRRSRQHEPAGLTGPAGGRCAPRRSRRGW